jgi:small-conductance mechanosensitive channel
MSGCSTGKWQYAVTQRRGSSSYCVASVSCWRKEAGGVAANWFPSDDLLALQWWNRKFGMRCPALDMAFVQGLVSIVVAGRSGMSLAHNRWPRMENVMHQMISLSLGAKLGFAVLGILVIHAVFRLLEERLPAHFRELDARYRVRKLVVFAGYGVGIVFVTVLFEDRLGRLTFALGVAGAGLVVALQDVIASFAGWLAIGWSNLYEVGDRVQIGETKGDVIDISFMRTEVVETGNWVSNDLYNGRVVRIPNSAALKGPTFNYSQGFRFVWDEIKVPLTADSDHLMARAMLLRIAKETIAGYLAEAEGSWKQVTDNFRIENLSLEPTVTLIVNGGSLEFTLSYIVDYTNRSAMQDQLFSKIVEEVKSGKGHLAWASSSSDALVRQTNHSA